MKLECVETRSQRVPIPRTQRRPAAWAAGVERNLRIPSVRGLILGLCCGLLPCLAAAQPWANKTQLPDGAFGHVAAVSPKAPELLFVFGGGIGNAAYDQLTDTWDGSSYTPLPTQRFWATETVDSQGDIWVIGGLTGAQALSTVEIYDPDLDMWTTGPSLLTPRNQAAAATGPNGRIFVFGGDNGSGSVIYDSVEMYDPATGSWVSRTPMPEPQRRLGAELGCDGLIYVMGRDSAGTHAINFAYDPALDVWISGKALPPTGGGLALGGRGMTTSPGGRIFLINDGEYNTNSDPRVFSYDPQHDQWHVEPSTIVGYTALAAATLGDAVFAIGGVVRFPPVDTRRVEALGPIATNSPCDPECVLPPSGMVSWYPFDEGGGSVAADLVSGLNGSHLGQLQAVPGQVSNALSLAGSGSVIATHHPAMNFATGDGSFSLDLWLRHPTTGAVVSKYDPSTAKGYELYLEHLTFPELNVGLRLNSTTHLFDACTIPEDELWHHLAVVVDRSTSEVLCYLDGFLREVQPVVDTNSVDTTQPLLIGDGVHGAQYDGFVDELEIFGRPLLAAEIQGIVGATRAGKCKNDVHLPWDREFCRGESHVMVYVDVCNYEAVSRTFDLTFQGLAAGSQTVGGQCGIAGPTVFEDPMNSGAPIPPAITVTVPASTCQPVPIRIGRPAGMTMAKQVACYQAILTETTTGATAITTGSVQDRRDKCWRRSPLALATQLLGEFEPAMFSVDIENTTSEASTFDYVVTVMPADHEVREPVMSLNGQLPGVTLEGSATLEPAAVVSIPIEIAYERRDPLRFQEMVIFTRDAGEGELTPVGSVAFRHPMAGDALTSGLLGDLVWHDVNGDGVQNDGDSGIEGVVLRLVDPDGNLVATTTTDPRGAYLFTEVPFVPLTVEVDVTTLPSASVPSYDLDGVLDHRTHINLDPGQVHSGADFGYRRGTDPGAEIFHDADDWGGAAPGRIVCEPFEGEKIPPSGVHPTPYTTSGGSLLTTIVSPPQVDIQYLNPGLINGTGELHFRDFNQGVRITPPRTALAVAFDFDTAVESWVVEAGGLTTVLPSNSAGFIGYVLGGPVTSFDLTGAPGAQGGISIDNLCYVLTKEPLFWDGFESGDTSQWSNTQQ